MHHSSLLNSFPSDLSFLWLTRSGPTPLLANWQPEAARAGLYHLLDCDRNSAGCPPW